MAQPAFTYRGEMLNPDKRTFIVDSRLDDNTLLHNAYVFRSVKEALLAAEKMQTEQNTSAKQLLTIYISPGVYWIDDPDDPEIRRPFPGENIPYGMKLKVANLRLIGMTDNPENVVIASNRGQTLGAVGNFTMLHFDGDDIQTENITFGNYCNVDLVYPPDEKQNRKKRSETIVQAQLIICNSDRVVARNCRFISRLNSCPFAGARRALFDNCYFECTDDALCGTAVYLNSRFTFFSGKPFYSTQGTGAVFLNCDIHSLTRGRQYMVKAGSPVTMVDCRWTSEDPKLYIGWTQDPTDDLRSYQYNLTLNGEPLFINSDHPQLTVDMTDKDVLEAYRLQVPKALFNSRAGSGDTIIYNLYNLLRGNDDWDATEQKRQVLALCKNTGTLRSAWTDKPVRLQLSHRKAEIESGVDSVFIKDCWLRFATEADFNALTIKSPTRWQVAPEDTAIVELKYKSKGCLVKGKNYSDEARTVNLIATGGSSGLEAACVLTIKPRYLDAPAFLRSPRITVQSDKQNSEQLLADYELNLQGRADQSLITWYRCTDVTGSDAIPVAVSRLNEPELTYPLSPADNGYYIKVSVAPKHLRSHAGQTKSAITATPVNVPKSKISYCTDFHEFPTDYQPRLLPGFWTVDSYKPADTQEFDWTPNPENSWTYGRGIDGGAHSTGLLQANKGARLLYTPVEDNWGDMNITLTVDPCKSAGQGFGSATGQYMDIYIKFDTQTLSGYALRVIRTTKHDKAVDFLLMQYKDGIAVPITEPVSSICYRTGCTLQLKTAGNLLTAHAETSTLLPPPHRPGLTSTVDLSADITPNAFGGAGIQHTGSTGASATLLRKLMIDWE